MGQAMLKGGIVGCGSVANLSHIPVLRALKGVEIVAACDQRGDVAMETAKRFAIPRAYGDLCDMLKKESLDFVNICTPPRTHFQLSMQAIEAGLHVLVEKPMASNVIEADEMVSAAQANGVKLCVIANFLFTPVVQKAKHLLDAGLIGDLVAVDVEILAFRGGVIGKRDHWCHDLPGGIFGEYAPHAIYLTSAFLGNIDSVWAVADKYSDFPGMAADELTVLLKAKNRLGTFKLSCNSPETSFTLGIFGTKRNLHLDNFAMTMTQRRFKRTRVHHLVLDQLNSSLQSAMGAASTLVGAISGRTWYKSGHRIIIQGFLNSIRDNTEPPVTGEAGRETIRILEEIWRQIGQPKSSSPGKDSDE